MFGNWINRYRSRARDRAEAESEPPVVRECPMSGEYLSLYKYLENRYASVVVLTFSEIEDLLGFKLPAPARVRQDWWTGPDPLAPRPRYSDSWVLARRTAKPNLLAQTVVFERAVS